MLYTSGTYFALQSGQEYRALWHSPSQRELVERPDQCAFLKYTEDLPKKNIKGRKSKPKVMIYHENIYDTSRCFVNLYKLYKSKYPRDRPGHAFYLQSLNNPTAECWFSTIPIGHATLAKTISRVCHAAGIKRYKTIHSLRLVVTAGTDKLSSLVTSTACFLFSESISDMFSCCSILVHFAPSKLLSPVFSIISCSSIPYDIILTLP